MNFKPIETDENVLVMPGAVVCGDVTVGEGTAFWFNSVCRAELQPIKIGKRCNIQDCAVIHNLCTADPLFRQRLGSRLLLLLCQSRNGGGEHRSVRCRGKILRLTSGDDRRRSRYKPHNEGEQHHGRNSGPPAPCEIFCKLQEQNLLCLFGLLLSEYERRRIL